MSKQGQRNADRRHQLEALRAQQHRSELRRRLIVTSGAVLAVLLLAGVVWAGVASSRSSGKPATAGSSAPIAGLTTFSGLATTHVTGKVKYPQTPPVGGDHAATWQNCGIYTAPVTNETAVHSLEHGAMWITYQPSLSATELAALKADVAGQKYALVSPYPGLPSPIVASVWGAQLKLDTATDPRLKTFIATYASGQKAPEPGGECTGGTGTPTG